MSLKGEQDFAAAVRGVDVVQVTSFDTSRHWVLPALRARLLGKPVVRYWVGSDVLKVEHSMAERVRARLADLVVSANTVKWHNLRKELRCMGIASRVLPAPHGPVLAEPIAHLPEEFTVLAYLSNLLEKQELYGTDFITGLMHAYPQWRFLIANHYGKDMPVLPNVEYLGRVSLEEMDATYRRSTVLVRMTAHDGLPRMLLEAVGRGLHAVWNQPFPHCHLARTFEELCSVLESLERTPCVNTAGRDYVRAEHRPSTVAERWVQFYRQLIA